MDWFGGMLTVKVKNGSTMQFNNVSFAEAQRILDTRVRYDFVAEALYEPYTCSMEQNKEAALLHDGYTPAKVREILNPRSI